jgi:hypothetical protein
MVAYLNDIVSQLHPTKSHALKKEKEMILNKSVGTTWPDQAGECFHHWPIHVVQERCSSSLSARPNWYDEAN